MTESTPYSHLSAFVEKMKSDGMAPSIIDTFSHYYQQVVKGETGLLPDNDIGPVMPGEVEDAENLDHYRDAGAEALKNAVIIMLNGGLGTSMGLTRAKSLLKIKNDMSFLEIKLRQAQKSGASLALMNSFNTHADTMAAVSNISVSIEPYYFIQNKFPKILQSDFSPATWPHNHTMEWNPPGHGDIYSALHASGLLERLLKKGIKYAFISNSDNLGATLDECLLGYFSANGYPFMMEVARRTPADLKGGHIARHKKGNLVLREIAQCPECEIAEFQDIQNYRYFNTNNIWINLLHLHTVIQKQGAVFLPIILNPKTLDPRISSSPRVYQIETAMGSAISLFKDAIVTQISDKRFYPVKKCTDLMAIQSDCYHIAPDFYIVKNPARTLDRIQISLDPAFFGKIDMYNERFKQGVPSLVNCESLEIQGDVFFEDNVVIKGRVIIRNNTDAPMVIKQGSVIEDNTRF
jgi:UTP--glucose-1-phosphate uridylyltransferase